MDKKPLQVIDVTESWFGLVHAVKIGDEYKLMVDSDKKELLKQIIEQVNKSREEDYE